LTTPIGDAITGIGILIWMFLTMVVFFLWLNTEKRLDRYRLKYSFDRELEGKDISGEDKEFKLNRRERLFKRRTFKD